MVGLLDMGETNRFLRFRQRTGRICLLGPVQQRASAASHRRSLLLLCGQM